MFNITVKPLAFAISFCVSITELIKVCKSTDPLLIVIFPASILEISSTFSINPSSVFAELCMVLTKLYCS